MPYRLLALPIATVVCTVLASTPSHADCTDVLDSISSNVEEFRDLRGDWLETLASIGDANDETRTAFEDTAFEQKEQLKGLAEKIVNHGKLLAEACIQDE